jgi:hypothetical protein
MKIGLGDSARFPRRHRGWTSQLIAREFKPEALIR